MLHRPDYLWHKREIRASAVFLTSSTFSVPLILFLFQCWLMTRFCKVSWLCRHENHASLISYAKPRTSNLGAGVELESKRQQQQLEPAASHSTQPQTNKSRFELNVTNSPKIFHVSFFRCFNCCKEKIELTYMWLLASFCFKGTVLNFFHSSVLGLEPVLNIVLMESETSLEIFLMRSWHSKKQLLSTLQELKTTRFQIL